MSVDALRTRLHADLESEVVDATAILVAKTHAGLDELRLQQGIIAGLQIAQRLLDERYRNLYAIG